MFICFFFCKYVWNLGSHTQVLKFCRVYLSFSSFPFSQNCRSYLTFESFTCTNDYRVKQQFGKLLQQFIKLYLCLASTEVWQVKIFLEWHWRLFKLQLQFIVQLLKSTKLNSKMTCFIYLRNFSKCLICRHLPWVHFHTCSLDWIISSLAFTHTKLNVCR